MSDVDPYLKHFLGIATDVLTEAEARGDAIAAALTDEGGHLLAFVRNPAARKITVTTAVGKARCAALFGRDSDITAQKAKNSPAAFLSFVTASPEPFVIGAGGVMVDLVTTGETFAVGVAGAEDGRDRDWAKAIAAAFAPGSPADGPSSSPLNGQSAVPEGDVR